MDALSDTVHWPKTEAFFASVPQQGITLVRQPGKAGEAGCSKSDYEELRRRIKSGLLELRADDGSSLIDEVWDREQLYRHSLPRSELFVRGSACTRRPQLA